MRPRTPCTRAVRGPCRSPTPGGQVDGRGATSGQRPSRRRGCPRVSSCSALPHRGASGKALAAQGLGFLSCGMGIDPLQVPAPLQGEIGCPGLTHSFDLALSLGICKGDFNLGLILVLLTDFRNLLMPPVAFCRGHHVFGRMGKPKGIPKRVTRMVGRC